MAQEHLRYIVLENETDLHRISFQFETGGDAVQIPRYADHQMVCYSLRLLADRIEASVKYRESKAKEGEGEG